MRCFFRISAFKILDVAAAMTVFFALIFKKPIHIFI